MEPTEKVRPIIEAGADDRGSDPIADMRTVIIIRIISELKDILPIQAEIREVNRGSVILIMWVREAEVTLRLLLVINTLQRLYKYWIECD